MLSPSFPDDVSAMARALELAERGVGAVEPNPPVGAVVLDASGELVGEGYHQKFGGPHAEVHALHQAGDRARNGTLFVTLEPCCHHGKTPPCTRAILAAGIRRVVIAAGDPAPHVAGGGIRELKAAGVEVIEGVLAEAAQKLLAPFVMLVTQHRPFVHAKWAMTLDGKIASRTGHSQWISNPTSRGVVHQLRGRMDAILVGAGTVRSDDPLLTVRPKGPRTPTRIVVDRLALLPLTSRLVQTIEEAPVLIAATEGADKTHIAELQKAGVEVLTFSKTQGDRVDLNALLRELGKRQLSNILVEGGGQLLGSFFDADLIDELHVFLAPKLVGGQAASSPVEGLGLETIPELSQLTEQTIQILEGDVYINGRVRRLASQET